MRKTLADYNKNRDEFVFKTKFEKNKILDFEGYLLEDIYLNWFTFCDENLQRFSKNFDIQPSYFFYLDDLGANAYADKIGDVYYMTIFKGLVHELNLKLGDDLFSHYNLPMYDSLKLKSSISLEQLMFETSLVFTFYHEFAHLVQKSESKTLLTNEGIPNSKPFNFEQHLKEYDADLNGVNLVVNHIDEFFKTQLRVKGNFDDAKYLHYVALTSIVVTHLLFLNYELGSKKPEFDYQRFYLEESIHPHATIRITYIIEQYVENARQFVPIIDFQETLNNVVRLGSTYFRDNTIFNVFIEQLIENRVAINRYNEKLERESLSRGNLLRHRFELYNKYH